MGGKMQKTAVFQGKNLKKRLFPQILNFDFS